MTAEEAYASRLRLGLPDTGRAAWTFGARAHAWMYWKSEEAAQQCIFCRAPVVCAICDTCAADCTTDGRPDRCWEAHDSWRHGLVDRAFDLIVVSSTPRPGTVAPAPLPHWRRTS